MVAAHGARRLWQQTSDERRSESSAARRLQGRQGRRTQGRRRLRRRWSWRPVVQRLGLRRAGEGRRGARRHLHRGQGHAGDNDTNRAERLRTLADEGYNPVIAVGYLYSPAAAKVAAEFPDTNFAVIDGYSST